MKRYFSLLRKLIQKVIRYVTIGHDKPKVMKDAGFDFFWDDKKLQKLDDPITEMDIKELEWNLDLPHWEESLINDWNLTPREVIINSQYHQNHYKRIQKTDLKYPICITKNKYGKWFVLDGTHRLAKSYMNKQKKVKVKIIPAKRMAEIKKQGP